MGRRSEIKHLAEVLDWPQRAEKAGYRAAALADVSRVSPKTLQRFFRAYFGTTPQQWIDRLRQTLVEQSAVLDMAIRTKELANRFSYKNSSHFCHVFKEKHGLSLKEWKKTHGVEPGRPTESITNCSQAHFVANTNS